MGMTRWWAWQDLNLQPSGYEPLALTIELQALSEQFSLVGMGVCTGRRWATDDPVCRLRKLQHQVQ